MLHPTIDDDWYIYLIFINYISICITLNEDIETVYELFIWILTCVIRGGGNEKCPLHVHFEDLFT